MSGGQLHFIVQDNGTALPLTDIHAVQETLKRGTILRITPGSGKPVELVAEQHLPDGIDIAQSNGRMYWSNMGIGGNKNDGAVYSARTDGTDIKCIVPEGACHTPKQLIVEPTTKMLYFCDREGLKVWRCKLDGSSLEAIVDNGDWHDKDLIKDQTKWCVGIAVAPRLGKFFWTQKGFAKGGVGRIFSAAIEMPSGQNASNRKDIETVLDKLPEPIDLEWDDEDSALYWTDRGELPFGNTLNRKHFTNTTPEVQKALGYEVLAQTIGEAIGVRLDKAEKCAYTSDLNGRLWRISLDGSGKKEKLYEGEFNGFTGFAFYRS